MSEAGDAAASAADAKPSTVAGASANPRVTPSASVARASADEGSSGRTITPPRTAAPGGEDVLNSDLLRGDILSSAEDGTTPKERAVQPRADWRHFAPAVPRTPPRLVVAVTQVADRAAPMRRFLRHEWTLAVLGGLALSLVLNRGALTDPRHTLPQDIWDPSLVAYLIAWGGHALIHDPANLWHLNSFFPSQYGLAFTDSLLGYSPFAVFGSGPEAAVLRYNVIFILAQALAFVGAYALVRQLGVGRIGATAAGVAFALAPWRLGQAGHLHVLSTGGIVLALAMLARGHGVRWVQRSDAPPGHGDQTPKRPGWALAGWLVAAWQLTIGFGIGLVFAYVLLGCVLVGCGWWLARGRRRPPVWLLLADAAGGLIFAAVALLLARPYLKVLEIYPYAKRTVADVALFSPPLRGYFTAPPESLIWGDAHATSRALLSVPGEMDLLPGFTLYGLAAAGLFFSVFPVWTRLALLAGIVVSVALGMGTEGPRDGRLGYVWLLEHLPGFEGLRTSGRLVIWTTLLLALLAAGGVCSLVRRAERAARLRGLPQPIALARLALLVPVMLLFIEGLGTTPHATVPPAPPTLSTVSAPYLVLPTGVLSDMHVMLWSSDRFAPVVNGGSGFIPAELWRTRDVVNTFPDQASVEYLRQLGVKTVVVLPQWAAGTPWQEAAAMPIDGLGITRDVRDDAVVFHLS